MPTHPVIAELDALADDFCRRMRYSKEPLTPGKAKMFVLQHRLNSRHRNSVLKLRVATNCPIWDIRIGILNACSQEVIADNDYAGGKPHWAILEDLGVRIGLAREDIVSATPTASTQMAWLAWEALMSNRHWLEGIVANVCAERINVPGYGDGDFRKLGWFGYEGQRWQKLFGLTDQQLEFFGMHGEADREHSDRGWNAVAEHATRLHMEEQVLEACRLNFQVWEHYLNGIADAGYALDRKTNVA